MLLIFPYVLFSFVHFLGLPLIYLTLSHLSQIIIFTKNIYIFSHDHISDSNLIILPPGLYSLRMRLHLVAYRS